MGSLPPLPLFSSATRLLFENDKVDAHTYRKQLKGRCEELELELRAVQMRHNSLSPPNRLPPEILSRIFVIVAQDIADDWRHVENKLLWFLVAHICHHWRAVALDCTALWSRIVPTHPQFIKLALSRSKLAPLDVDVHSYQWEGRQYAKDLKAFSEALRLVLLQTSRLRTVELSAPRDILLPSFNVLEGVSGGAPLLRKLSLSQPSGTSWRLPVNFLQGGAPSLRHLALNNVKASWTQLPLPSSLVHLSLECNSLRPPIRAFFDSLAELTSLKNLTISECLPAGEYSAAPDVPSPLILSTLKEITIKDTATNIVSFFNAIRTPRIKNTTIIITDRHPIPSSVQRCLDKVKPAVRTKLGDFPALVHLNMQSLDFVVSFEEPIFLMVFGEDRLTISVGFKHHTFSVHQVLRTIRSNFSFSALETLAFYICYDVPQDAIVDIFARLPKLTKIIFYSSLFLHFLELMQRDPARKRTAKGLGSTAVATPYFPALKIIEIEEAQWRTDETGPSTVTRTLIDVLMKRPETYRIKTMSIKGCVSFGVRQWNALLDALPGMELTWDKKENWSDFPDDEYDDDSEDEEGEGCSDDEEETEESDSGEDDENEDDSEEESEEEA